MSQLPALIKKNEVELRRALDPERRKYINPEQWLRLAYAVDRIPALAQCTDESKLQAIMDAALDGLEIGGPNGHAAVVPYGRVAHYQRQWKGKAFLWMKAGAITKLKAAVVYKGDKFRLIEGDEDRIEHEPNYEEPRNTRWLNDMNNIVGAYAIAWLPSGHKVHKFLSRWQLERVVEFVKKKNGGNLGFGWQDWRPEMCCKTAVNRLDGFVQAPPEMTPEQMIAWQRAAIDTTAVRVDDIGDVEAVAEEYSHPHDDLPQAEVSSATPETVEPEPVEAEVEDPQRLINEGEQSELLRMAKQRGKTQQQCRIMMKVLFGVDDMARMKYGDMDKFISELGQ